jgi:hypothetical protein
MADDLDALMAATEPPANAGGMDVDSLLAATEPPALPSVVPSAGKPSLFDPNTGMRLPDPAAARMAQAGSAWSQAMSQPVNPASRPAADFVGRNTLDILKAVMQGEGSGLYQRNGLTDVNAPEGMRPGKAGALAALGIPSDVFAAFVDAMGKGAAAPVVAMGDKIQDPQSIAALFQKAGEGLAMFAPGAPLKVASKLEELLGTLKPYSGLDVGAPSAFRPVSQGLGTTPNLATESGFSMDNPVGWQGVKDSLLDAQKSPVGQTSPLAGVTDPGSLLSAERQAETAKLLETPQGYSGLTGKGKTAKSSLPAAPKPTDLVQVETEAKSMQRAVETTPTVAAYATPAELAPLEGPGMRESRMAAAMRVSEDTPPLVRAELNLNPRMHNIARESETVAQAQKLTAAEKEEQLFKSNGPLDKLSAAAGHLLMDEKFKAGDMAGGMRAMDQLILRNTESGQGLEINRVFREMTDSPDAMAFWAGRAFRNSRDAVVSDFVAKHEALKGISEQGIRQLAASQTVTPEVKSAIRAVKELDKYTLPPEELGKLITESQRINAMAPSIEQEIASAKLIKSVQDRVVRRSGVNRALATVDALHVVSILGNVKTPFRNVLGNSVMAIVDNLKQRAAAAIDWTRSSLTGAARERFMPPPLTDALSTGVARAKREAMAIKAGVDLDAYAASKFGSDTPAGVRFEGPTPQALLQAWGDYSLRVPDQFFAGIGEYNSLHNSAMTQAFAEGLRGKDQAVRVAELIANPTTDMKVRASLDGLYATFRDPSLIAKAFQMVRTGMNLGQPFGLGSLVLRFPRTPANILKAVEEYSPFGFLNSLYHVARKTSSAGMAEDALSKALIGSSGTALGYYLTDMGVMRGTDDPKDRQLNAMNRSLGRQGSSFNGSALPRFLKSWDPADLTERPGDKWVNLSDIQPFGSTILMGADAKRASSRGEGMLSVLQKPSAFGEMAAGALETLADASFVSPLRNFMDPSQDFCDSLMKVVTDAPSGFVPSILNQFAQFDDNIRRYQKDPSTLRTMGNHLMARIPLLSYVLPKQANILGADDVRYPGGNNAWDVFSNPIRISEVYSGPQAALLLEIAQHAEKTGQKDILPSFAKQIAEVAGIPSEQLSEQDVVQMQRQLGMRFKQSLLALQQTPEWQNPKGATQEERDAYKITAMAKAVSAYREYASKEFFADYLKTHGAEAFKVNRGVYKQMQDKPTLREKQ